MLTDFQKHKLSWYFHILDIDKNGFIEKQDWDSLAENLCALRGIPFGTDAHAEVMKVVGTVWENTKAFCGVGDDGRITLEEWLDFEEAKAVNCDDDWYDGYVNKIVRGVFDAFDDNGDGKWSLKEWTQLYAAWRVEPRMAPHAFSKIDRDGNGYISIDEFILCVKEFHQSNDPKAPGNWLFGEIPAKF